MKICLYIPGLLTVHMFNITETMGLKIQTLLLHQEGQEVALYR